MIFLGPLAFFDTKNLEVCLQLAAGDRIRRLRGFKLIDPCICFNRSTRTRRYFTPEIHSPVPQFLKSDQTSKSSCSASLSGKLCLSPLVLAPPREHQTFVWMSGYLQDNPYLLNRRRDGQASHHPLHQTNSAPLFFSQSGVISIHPSTTCGSRSMMIFFLLHPLQPLREISSFCAGCVGSGRCQKSLERAWKDLWMFCSETINLCL